MNKLCQSCGSPLTFNVLSQKLHCKTCGSNFDVDKTPNKETEEELLTAADFMNARIYRCDTCGAEISATKEEVATICVYCGNPTIVFSRIAKSRRPEKMIPFTITKEKAIDIFKKTIKKSKYTPSAMKKIDFDSVRGVYIPFYKHNLSSFESVSMDTAVNGQQTHFKNNFAAVFDRLLVDASFRLDDSVSCKLEPYDLMELELFSEDVLYGFYADMADVSVMESREVARKRAAGVLHREYYRNKICMMTDRKTSHKFNGKSTLIMLPAWFLTYKYKGTSYTVMINGQTGKVIGGVPWSNSKLALEIIGKAILVAAPLATAFSFIWKSDFLLAMSGFYALCGMMLSILPLAFIVASCLRINKLKKKIKSGADSNLISFANNRQEGL